MNQISSLSNLLALPAGVLDRHLQIPLSPPQPEPLKGWSSPEIIQHVLRLCDGFRLFGVNEWDSFRLWGAEEYREHRQVRLHSQKLGILPIFGDVPHLTSIRVSDGVVISTDWEIGENGEGWGTRIAESLQEYVKTLIHVREAYGDGDMPSDWWHPYAAHGTRFDLDK